MVPFIFAMNEVFNDYTTALDELNVLATTSYYSADSTETIIDDMLSVLIKAYRMGIDAAGKMINAPLSIDTEDMFEAIFYFIDGETFENRIRTHVSDGNLTGLQTLMQSEFERIFNVALYDGGRQHQEATGEQVYKTWLTMMDGRVRDTHDYLEGMTVPLGEYFFTWDGDSALAPHGFYLAKNNVNCRCVLMLSKGYT